MSPTDVPAQTQPQDSGRPGAPQTPPDPSGFGARGRIRRRARFLRKARELGYRDLGGLVFNLHRFGQRNDSLVLAKLTLLGQIDDELRALEGALAERQSVTVLREAGITACPRCAAIHSSEDRFCPNCGLSMGRHPDLPIAGAAAPPPGVSTPAAMPAAAAPAATPPVAAAPAASMPATTSMPATASIPATATTSPVPASATAPQGEQPGAPTTEGEITEILRPPARGS
jgi:hypothetical protein